jgi:hypothetical protein
MLPSVDLGSIIVRSLETSLKDLDTRDSKDMSDAITEGINKSIIGKPNGPLSNKNGKNFAGNNINALTKEEKELQKLKKKNLQDEDKQRKSILKDMAKGYADLFKNLESNLKGTFEKTFSALNTFTNNPLEGFDKGLQAVIKGSLGAVDKVMNTQIKLPGSKSDGSKADKEKLAPVTTLINEKSAKFEEQMKALIDDNKSGNEKISSNLVQLSNQIKANERKGDGRHTQDVKEGAIKEKKRSSQADSINKGIATTNLTLGTIGQTITMVALGVLAFLATWPVIRGKVSELLLKAQEMFTKFFDVTLPNLVNKIKVWLPVLITDLVEKLKLMFKPALMEIKKLGINLNPFMKEADKKKALAEMSGMTAEQYEFYSGNSKAMEILDERKKLRETADAQKQITLAREAEYKNYLKEHGVKDIKELGAGGLFGIGATKEYKEAEALKNAYEKALGDQKSTLGRMSYTANEYVNVDGKKVRVVDLEKNEEYADTRKKFDEMNAILAGKSEADMEAYEADKEKRHAEAELKEKAKYEDLVFSHDLKQSYKSTMEEAMRTGVLKGRQLTPEQMGRLKDQYNSGEWRKWGKLEEDAAIAQVFTGAWGNTVGELGHNLAKSTATPYQGQNVAQGTVNGGNYTVVKSEVYNVNSTVLSGQGHYHR